jgi:UTP--glucose-1-phosphate uridylyltransferase
MKVRTAVIPAAGRGTRLLPVTKAVPKELLPLGTVPALQLVLEECARAGMEVLVFVVSPDKEALRRYLTPSRPRPEGPADLVRLETLIERFDIRFVTQPRPLGLGHAVWTAAEAVPDERFAVVLPDELYPRAGEGLDALLDQDGEAVLLLSEVGLAEVARYGVAAGEQMGDRLVVRTLVEKPDPAHAPSRLAVFGRYVFGRSLFAALEGLPPGRGGEVQLTDAVARLMASGQPVRGVIRRPFRLDVGDAAGYRAALEAWLAGL